MGLFTVLPLQVAFALFGGDNESRKLLNVKKGKEVRQVVWGAAWDMLYVFVVQQHASLLPIDGIAHRPVLVTGDKACYIIASRCRLRGAIKSNERILTPFVQVSAEYPHFRSCQAEIQALLQSLRRSQVKRVTDWMLGKERPTLEPWQAEMKHLERELLRDTGLDLNA